VAPIWQLIAHSVQLPSVQNAARPAGNAIGSLIDWTMQEARQLSPEHRTHSAVDGSFDRLLEAFKERLKPNTDDTISQIASSPIIQLDDESPTEQSFSEVVAPPKPDIVSNLPAPTPAAPPADGRSANV
jgi:hypothetical protein